MARAMADDLYASEDAQQILQIAIARQTEVGELSRTQLVEIASELGISADTLWQAEQEWLVMRGEAEEHNVFKQYRHQRFQHHLVRYVAVNTFLFLLNWLMGLGFPWAVYIMVIWGLVLVLHAWHTYQPNPYRYDDEFQKWRQRRKIKQSFNRLVDRLFGS